MNFKYVTLSENVEDPLSIEIRRITPRDDEGTPEDKSFDKIISRHDLVDVQPKVDVTESKEVTKDDLKKQEVKTAKVLNKLGYPVNNLTTEVKTASKKIDKLMDNPKTSSKEYSRLLSTHFDALLGRQSIKNLTAEKRQEAKMKTLMMRVGSIMLFMQLIIIAVGRKRVSTGTIMKVSNYVVTEALPALMFRLITNVGSKGVSKISSAISSTMRFIFKFQTGKNVSRSALSTAHKTGFTRVWGKIVGDITILLNDAGHQDISVQFTSFLKGLGDYITSAT